MGFLRRNRDPQDKEQQAVPAAPQQQAVPAQPANAEEAEEPGWRKWLRPSHYAVLYSTVFAPSLPKRSTLAVIALGFILGLVWAYGLAPTVFYGANPNRLNDTAQEAWVRLVAVSHTGQANYDQDTALNLLSRVPNPAATIDELLANPEAISEGDRLALQELRALIPEGFEAAEPITPRNPLVELLIIVVVTVVVIVAFALLVLAWRLIIYPEIGAPIYNRFRMATDKEFREQKQREAQARAAARAAKKARDSMVIEADADYGEPVMKTLSIYDQGRSYDDSFEIELASGDFLGQCGAALAEATDPDPVAIELWLFDMFSQQNVKKLFISPAVNNDPALRSRLESSVSNPMTDLVVAQPGAKLIVDSDKLRLQGEMTDLQVDANGRFQHFQMPIAAWQKDVAPAAAPAGGLPDYSNMQFDPPPQPPAGGRSMDEYSNMQFDPPPQPPAGGRSMDEYSNMQFDPPPQPPAGGRSMDEYSNMQFDPPPQPPGGSSMGQGPAYPPGSPTPLNSQQTRPSRSPQEQQPLTPPPLNYPPPEDRPADEDEDDDPFGGTGDFTPLPNN